MVLRYFFLINTEQEHYAKQFFPKMLMSEQSRSDQEHLANNAATYRHLIVLARLGQNTVNIKGGIPHFENIDNSNNIISTIFSL